MARKKTTTRDIKKDIKSFQKKYACFNGLKDYQLFTLFCIKNFFYNDSTTSFDPEVVLNYLVDGTNDGGIDAVFNDPKSEENDVVIIQSKYYDKSSLNKDKVTAETKKLIKTAQAIANGKVEGYSNEVKTAYKTALGEKSDDGKTKIFFFTTFVPKTSRTAQSIRTSFIDACEDYDGMFAFYSDIVAQINENETGKLVVESGDLRIQSANNILKYEDSFITNISAKSLQDLYITRGNNLLGLNLRFYVKNKSVDSDIEYTIHNESNDFWYKNNGIVIACEDYSFVDNTLHLSNFSIINGGQTTHRIGYLNITDDFYLLCKVVKLKGNSPDDKLKFANSIAIATNAQKAIKPADLRANTPEQQKLKQRLSQVHIYYKTKNGNDSIDGYDKNTEIVKIDKVGKIGLAAFLQMPGAARSSPTSEMFSELNYDFLFGDNVSVEVIRDSLKILHSFENYKKRITKLGIDSGFKPTTINIIRNGSMHILACFAYLAKIAQGIFTHNEIILLQDNSAALKQKIRMSFGMKGILCSSFSDEQTREKLTTAFNIISDDVLATAFDKSKTDSDNETNWLKNDNKYHKYVLDELWKTYKQNGKFSQVMSELINP